MASLLEQIGNVARDAAQGLACGIENYQDFVRRLNPLGDVIPPPPSLWPLLCPDEPPPDDLFPRPPFEGGQCEGVLYNIFTEVLSGPNAGPPSFRGSRTGPITYYENAQGEISSPTGIPLFGRVICGTTPSGQSCFQLGSPNPNVVDTWERADGQPDECGDPPPAIPIPPTPLPPIPPEDRPVTDPDGGPDIDFTFAPTVGPIFIDIDGSLKIPVNVNVSGPNIFAPINVPVNISLPDFNPTFNIGGGGGGGGEPGPPEVPCCDPPERPGPEEEGDEDEPIEVEPDEDGATLFGVRVRCTVNSASVQATRVGLTGNAPDLWVPRIATVLFELVSEDENGAPQISSSSDYSIKTTNQMVLAPDGVTVRRIFVAPSKGVSVAATPIYKRKR